MEIERRAHHQEAFRPGEALELDAERAAHRAAGAVGTDEPTAAPWSPPRPLRPTVIATPERVLLDPLQWRIEKNLKVALAAQLVEQDARQLRLLALQPMRMRGEVGDSAEIELGQQSLLLGAVLELRRDQPLR